MSLPPAKMSRKQPIKRFRRRKYSSQRHSLISSRAEFESCETATYLTITRHRRTCDIFDTRRIARLRRLSEKPESPRARESAYRFAASSSSICFYSLLNPPYRLTTAAFITPPVLPPASSLTSLLHDTSSSASSAPLMFSRRDSASSVSSSGLSSLPAPQLPFSSSFSDYDQHNRRPVMNHLPSFSQLNQAPISPPVASTTTSTPTLSSGTSGHLLIPPTYEAAAQTTDSGYPSAMPVPQLQQQQSQPQPQQSSSFPNTSSLSYWAAASSNGTHPSTATPSSERRMSFSSTSSQYSLPSISSTPSSSYNSTGGFYQPPAPPLLPPPSSISIPPPQQQQSQHSKSGSTSSTPTGSVSSFLPSPPEYASSSFPYFSQQQSQSQQPQQQPQQQQQPYYSEPYQPWQTSGAQQTQQSLGRRPSLTAPRSFDNRYQYPPPLSHLPPPHMHPHMQQQQAPLQDRPFKCDQCLQSFNRNHDLKRHKRIHLDVKPFPCANCDKTFSRKDALKRHTLVKGCGGGRASPTESSAAV
ncbi:uncharacterized protein V2V93DRAFT_357778 [Kockiozyma suomiensis]|uniref:uncharacterized protein n=1 Tax=Kockiozyma suomiensis TaxID=1337062 RepID=UPI003343D07A